MDAKTWGREVAAGTQRQLSRWFGDVKGGRQDYLWILASDAREVWDDFDGAINTNWWTAAATATGTAFAAGNVLDGTLTGATGTTNNAGISLKGPLSFPASCNPSIEIRFKVSANSLLQLELGFLDAITTATGPAFSSIDTPAVSAGVGDAAMVGLRTTDTLATLALLSRGSGGGAQVASKLAMGTLLPTAATYMTVKIALINETGTATTAIVATVDGPLGKTQQYVQSTAAGQIVAATVLRPWIYFGDLGTTTRTADVDYIRVVADRV